MNKDKQIEKDYAAAQAKWLETNGFSADGLTYVFKGESYSIKDELKAAGFKYNSTLKWHKAEFDPNYADRLVKVELNQVVEMSAWGQGHYKADAADFINKLTVQEREVNTASQWLATPGEYIKDHIVKLVRKGSFNGRYGVTNVITFEDRDRNLITWFTTTNPPFVIGDELKIVTAKVKDLNEYRGERATVITRPRLEALN